MNEKAYLSEMAKVYLSYANSPQSAQKVKDWYEHNACISNKPMVVMEIDTFLEDIMPPLRCETRAGRFVEKCLQRGIVNEELIGDDKVLTPYIPIPMAIGFKLFDLDIVSRSAKDLQG